MSKSTNLAVISGALMIASMSWESSFPSAFAGNGPSNLRGVSGIMTHLNSKVMDSKPTSTILEAGSSQGTYNSADGKAVVEHKSSQPSTNQRTIDEIQMETLRQDLAEVQKELMHESGT